MEIRIQNHKQMEKWLSEQDYFSDGACLSVEPVYSNEGQLPHSVSIRLSAILQTDGWEAGKQITYNVFDCKFAPVTEFEFPEGMSSADHCMNGVDSIGDLVGIELFVPGKLRIVAKECLIRAPQKVVTRIKPWIGQSISAEFPKASFPTPQDWVNWCRDEGVEVAWRIHGLPAKKTSDVPADNYEGFYLIGSRIEIESTTGIFFFNCRKTDNGFRVTIELKDPAEERAWLCLKRIMFRFGEGKITVGNCVFSLVEWERYVQSGQLPARYQLS